LPTSDQPPGPWPLLGIRSANPISSTLLKSGLLIQVPEVDFGKPLVRSPTTAGGEADDDGVDDAGIVDVDAEDKSPPDEGR